MNFNDFCVHLFIPLFFIWKKKTLETYEASTRLAFLQQIFLACHKSESTGGIRELALNQYAEKQGLQYIIKPVICDLDAVVSILVCKIRVTGTASGLQVDFVSLEQRNMPFFFHMSKACM